jgi:hypothetical protein
MVTTLLIKMGANAVVLGLTPIEKWQAARRLDVDVMSEHWFILTSIAAIITLVVIFVIVSRKSKKREHNITNQLFSEYANSKGLSSREREILLDITTLTKLKRSESIFTMVTAFDRGADELIEQTRARNGTATAKGLSTELSVLREKLGFQKKTQTIQSKKTSSREIPAGKKLHVTRRKSDDVADIESTVLDNNDIEFTIELSVSLESKPGEQWCVRYYFGASVWEFETSVISCNGNILVLNHSDNVRFINRRRFLRAPVNRPTFIAHFPFAKTLSTKEEISGKEHNSSNGTEDKWGPPEFVPANVTELAGPGLRIEAPLEVNVGDRVLVVLQLNEEESSDSDAQKVDSKIPLRIVEDIGEVRHAKVIESGFSIAVELMGANDSNISELIRATNAALMKTKGKSRNVPEPAAVQGV